MDDKAAHHRDRKEGAAKYYQKGNLPTKVNDYHRATVFEAIGEIERGAIEVEEDEEASVDEGRAHREGDGELL